MILLLIWSMAITFNINTLIVGSPAFKNQEVIPSKYTCEGKNVNPPLTIENIPEVTKTLVLIVDDPDAPAKTFDHWLVWNIGPISELKENSAFGVQGKNSAGKNRYTGPCPPSGTHRYFFKVYALDTWLDLPEGSGKMELQKAMQGHVIASGELMGLYEKKKK